MAIVDQYKYFSMMVMVIVAARIDIHTLVTGYYLFATNLPRSCTTDLLQ